MALCSMEKDCFLGSISGLCSLIVRHECPSGALVVSSADRRRVRGRALQRLLFGGVVSADAVPVLCRLYAVWFTLSRRGRHQQAERLHRLLQALGPQVTPEVAAVLRLILCLSADVDRPAEPPDIGQFRLSRTTVAGVTGVYTDYPSHVFSGRGVDPRAECDVAAGALQTGLLGEIPGSGCSWLSVDEEPRGGPLKMLVNRRCRATIGDMLHLPPLPIDPNHVPLVWRKSTSELDVVERTAIKPSQPVLAAVRADSIEDALWEAVLATPEYRRRCWESRGRVSVLGDRRLLHLTDSGPQVLAHLQNALSFRCRQQRRRHVVQEAALLEDCRHLLLGSASDSFSVQQAGDVFVVRGGLCTPRVSCGSVRAVCRPWLLSGQQCRRVTAAVSRLQGEGSLVLQALLSAVDSCLSIYRSSVISLKQQTLLQLYRQTTPLLPIIRLLDNLCRTASVHRRRPMMLISHVHKMLMDCSHDSLVNLLAFIFRRTISPYLRFVSDWVFSGECRNPSAEFPIVQCSEYAHLRDEQFWTEGFTPAAAGSQRDHPVFLQSLSHQIHQCGRALNLLKLCVPDHPLCTPGEPQSLQLAFSLDDVEEVRHSVVRYEAEAQQHLTGSFASVLQRQKTEKQELTAAASAQTLQSVARIREKIAARRSREAEKRRLQLVELNQQLDEVQAERRRRRLQEQLQEAVVQRQMDRVEMDRTRREMSQRLDRVRKLQQLTGSWSADLKDRILEISASIVSQKSVDGVNESVDIAAPQSIGGKEQPVPQTSLSAVPVVTPFAEQLTAGDPTANVTADRLETEAVKPSVLCLDGEALPSTSAVSSDRQLARRRIASEGAEARRRNRQRVMSGEFQLSSPDEPPSPQLLVDRIGGALLRPRGRNVHGHSTDSQIQCVIYQHADSVESKPRDIAPPRTRDAPTAIPPLPAYEPPSFCGAGPAVGVFRHHRATRCGRDAAAVTRESRLTLSGTLLQSVALPVHAQTALVNWALVNHLLVTAGLVDHLLTLRRFLLLQDGLFTGSLCHQLCQRLAGPAAALVNPVTLKCILDAALSASIHGEHPLTDNLSFVITSAPDRVDACSPSALHCLQLDYRAGWPHCIVLTESCRLQYQQLLHVRLQLLRASWCLQQTAGQLRRRSGWQAWRLQLSRHEMQQVVSALCGYTADWVLVVCWSELQTQLEQSVPTLDRLRSAHTAYLAAAADRCLLTPRCRHLLQLLHELCRIVFKFHALVTSADWPVGMLHPSYQQAARTHGQFAEFSRLLSARVDTLRCRYYQPHLTDLANRLNFNRYYSP